MEIETIFFDLGGVLIDFSHEKMCKNLSSYCQIPLDEMKKFFFEEGMSDAYERGVISSEDLHEALSHRSPQPLNYEDLLDAAAQIFSPKPEMAALLEKLKAEGIRLILLSNTCEAHFWHAQRYFGFLDLFDGFALSYEVKARKPERAIYDAALNLGNTAVEKCFYTDDIPEYVTAAKAYGIDSHLFENFEKLSEALDKRGLKGVY